MAHSGYSVSSASIGYTPGNSATSSGNSGVFTLLITPDVGYVVAATDFYIGDPYDGTKINNVVFTDSQHGANHVNNFVIVTVTMQSTYVVSANETIYIDIDGIANPIVVAQNVEVCLRENVQMEASCPMSYWPASGGPIVAGMAASPSPTCITCFVEDEYDSNVPTVTASPQPSNTNWPNPLLNIPYFSANTNIDTSEVTDYSVTHTPGTPTILYTKTYWTPPKYDFHTTPFYELNAAAVASGDWIIEETQDNYNVDKTLLSPVNNSHILHCDTTEILPGMQVTGSSIITCAYSGTNNDPNNPPTNSTICFPGWGMDIRVVKVVPSSNEVHITESLVSLASGDIINFSSQSMVEFGTPSSSNINSPRVVAKQFVVKYNGTQEVPCGDHVINWAHHTDLLQSGSSGQSQPKIINTNINTEYLTANGGTKRLNISGTASEATFSINISRTSDFKSYDFTEDKFTAGASDLIDQTVDGDGKFTTDILFPPLLTDDTYNITITAKTTEATHSTTIFDSGVNSTFEIKQYTDKTVTLTTEGTGLTLASGLTTNLTVAGRPGINRNTKIPTWTGTITKPSDALYVKQSPNPCRSFSTGDFNFNTTSVSPADGKDNDTKATLTPTITGSGTATLTVTIEGLLHTIGTANTTITFDVDDIVTARPSVPDIGGKRGEGGGGNPSENAGRPIEVSISGDTNAVDIDVRSFDNDANKSSKTLSIVTEPQKGTLGAYTGESSAWDNGKVRYTGRDDRIYEVGETDQFVYQATVDGGASDVDGRGTITITFVE